MKKQGFTLIELLAVIVVLAIIALIATPIVLNLINDAKKGAAESSAYAYVKAVENAIATYMLNNNASAPTSIDDLTVEVKGDKPNIANSKVCLANGVVSEALLEYDNYKVYYDGTKAYVDDDREVTCDITSTPSNPQPQQPVAYYAFGEPTTSSPTDYTTLGKNVFVKLEGEQKSVCIVRNGELSCLKNNNYTEYSSSLPTTGFAGMSCTDHGSVVSCNDGAFDCGVISNGNVSCYDLSTFAYCDVYASGNVSCH